MTELEQQIQTVRVHRVELRTTKNEVEKIEAALREQHQDLYRALGTTAMALKTEEARLLLDPSGRCTIKFSSIYEKMPGSVMAGEISEAKLLAVLKVKRAQLSSEFLEWDTKFADKPGNFPLPAGQEFLVLLLLTDGQLWTTIRAAWPPEKEDYYRSHIGELVNIAIEG